MFAKAIEKTAAWIRPVLTSNRYYDGTVETGGGTLTIINKDGWFLSASHVFECIPLFRMHSKEYEDFEAKVAKLKESKTGKKELKRFHPNPKWITASSIWSGESGQKVLDLSVIPEADILIGRLDPFDPSKISEYPKIKNPKDGLKVGTSLCKLGYAYNEIETTFNKTTNSFNLDFKNLVSFPIEGMHTRDIMFKTPEGHAKEDVLIKFVETSSPGLRGQSGCPVFDTDGAIWGIQSRTTHLPLGFSPSIESKGKRVVENQFLNVGWAIHPDVIIGFLKERGIEFETTD